MEDERSSVRGERRHKNIHMIRSVPAQGMFPPKSMHSEETNLQGKGKSFLNSSMGGVNHWWLKDQREGGRMRGVLLTKVVKGEALWTGRWEKIKL